MVGAYRAAEAKNSPLLLETMEKLKREGADLEIMPLKPLESPSIADLILNCVPCVARRPCFSFASLTVVPTAWKRSQQCVWPIF